MFNKICIIGCGLIGSSILRGTEEKKIAHDWLEYLVAASASQGHDDGSGDGMPAGIHTEMQRTFVYTLWGSVSGNDKYFQRFGYVFLVCATGKSALEMLNLLESRINNSPEKELQIAQQEQQKIMLLRLEKMFQ